MMARGQQKGTRMYKTLLVTWDCTATGRAIIEHSKQLAKGMQSRVVLLHVATGALAKYHGENAAGAEGEESRTYLDRVQAEVVAAGIPADVGLALRGTGQRNRPLGSAEKTRPGGDEHARSSFHGRSGSRNNGHNGTAQRQCSGSSAPGQMIQAATSVIVHPCDRWTFNKSATNWPSNGMMVARISFRWKNCGGVVRARVARARRTFWGMFTKIRERS